MKIGWRLKIWQKLAQTVEPEPETAITTPIPGIAPNISLSQIPTFKIGLFSNKTDFVQDIQKIVDIINRYLFEFSNGKIDFSILWKANSIDQNKFSGALNHLYGLAKWFYQIISNNGPSYTIDNLKKILNDLSTAVNTKTFQHPSGTRFKTELTSYIQVVINKLGD